MGEFSRQDVAEDLEIPVRMGWEPTLGLDAVFVEDSQRAEVGETRVIPYIVLDWLLRMVGRSSFIQSAKLKL